MIRNALTALLLVSAGYSQTFVVDAANGPGTNFTNLQTAINTVPDGAILLIRPGDYFIVQINAKGLSLLATAPGATVGSAFATSLTVRDLSIRAGGPVQIALQQCAGPVLIENIDFDATVVPSPTPFCDGISIASCAQVTIRNCHVLATHALIANASTVAIENCDLIGRNAFVIGQPQPRAGPGIDADHADLVLSRCHVRGGNGLTSQFPQAAPQPAIHCNAASIRICDDTNGSYVAGVLAGSPVSAIAGSGSVERDPSPSVLGSNGASGVDPGMLDVVRPLPSLRTMPASPGGTVFADVTTPIGELVLLALSLPGPVTTVPGVDGAFWLDGGTATLMTLGVPQPGVPVQFSIAVPPGPGLVGARFTWQAVAYSAANGLRASNPSTYAN
jgi:hypothetical protein